MELITALKILRAHILWVIGGGIVAVAIGVVMLYHVGLGFPPKIQSRDYVIGQGSAQALIDTQQSQIAAQGTTNQPDNLYQRAAVLADLMASGPEQEAVAKKLGISLEQLQVTPPPSSIVQPIRATSLGVAAQKLAGAQATWQLSVVIDPELPLMAFNTIAPTPQDAQKLASAAIEALRERMQGDQEADHVPATQRLIVDVIGPPLGGPLQEGPHKIFGVMVVFVIFGLVCFTIVVVGGRRRRLAYERARGEALAAHGLASPPPLGDRPAATNGSEIPSMPEIDWDQIGAAGGD
jgi:hypothetical protein